MAKTHPSIPHVVLRVGSFQDRYLGQDVIEAHNAIAEQHGKVFLGKAGRTLAKDRLQQVREAIADFGKSRLVLVRKQSSMFQGFAATLLGIPGPTFTPDLKLVPEYYHDLVPTMSVWFEIESLLPIGDSFLKRLHLLSNNRPLIETLLACRTSLMLVAEE